MFSKTIETKKQVAERISQSLSEKFSEIAIKASLSASNKEKAETYGKALIEQKKLLDKLKGGFKGISNEQLEYVFQLAVKIQKHNALEKNSNRSPDHYER